MHPVTEPGKIANWIAPPATGIKGKPFEFEYVRPLEELTTETERHGPSS